MFRQTDKEKETTSNPPKRSGPFLSKKRTFNLSNEREKVTTIPPKRLGVKRKRTFIKTDKERQT